MKNTPAPFLPRKMKVMRESQCHTLIKSRLFSINRLFILSQERKEAKAFSQVCSTHVGLSEASPVCVYESSWNNHLSQVAVGHLKHAWLLPFRTEAMIKQGWWEHVVGIWQFLSILGAASFLGLGPLFLDELPLPRRGLGDKGSEWSGSETIESSSNRSRIPYLIAIGRYL